jgi:hypothetical protein
MARVLRYIDDRFCLSENTKQPIGASMQRIQNKVLVHFQDGKILKGHTGDFNPNQDAFHISSVQDGTEFSEDLTKMVVAGHPKL